MIWWMAALALAQDVQQPVVPELNTQLFRPTFDSRATLWSETSGTFDDDGPVARALVGYVREPLVFVLDGGDKYGILNDAMQVELLGAYRFDRFRIGVDLPVYLLTTSDVANGGAGTGDLAVDGRVALLDSSASPVGLALSGRMLLPTASVDVPLGAAGLGGEVMAIATTELDAMQLNLNVGQRFLPSTTLAGSSFDDELFFVLGGGYALTDRSGISGDLGGTVNYRALDTGAATLPLELIAGGWGRVSDDFVVRGGAGRGLTPGIGSPSFRALVGISYEPSKPRDRDVDGIVDASDGCPDDPEDRDEFEDHDGCPDLDNDLDGIADLDDGCPLEPEDMDGFDDEDGCADFSRQIAVRVLDEHGKDMPAAQVKVQGRNTELHGVAGLLADLHDGTYTVSASAEEYLGAELTIALPLAKKAGDEVVLRLHPEARVGTLEVQVLDPDGLAIADASWHVGEHAGPPLADGSSKLQMIEGEHVLVVRAPGYGPVRLPVRVTKNDTTRTVVMLQPAKVKVTREQIDIKETIYFETAKAVIKPESFPLLNEVAQILHDHPEIELVRIEGHTDSRGSESLNQSLSEKRAASVLEYLVGQKIERERLESVGYGESRPIDPREVPEAWDKNRRVDFFIEKRAADEE